MNVVTEATTGGRKLWIGIRFVLFGIGGFWLLMGSSLDVIEALSHHPRLTDLPIPALAVLVVVGGLMMLFAVGEWGRWAYLLVFLSFPASIALLAFMSDRINGAKGSFVAAISVVAFASYAGVKAYYQWRARKARQSE